MREPNPSTAHLDRRQLARQATALPTLAVELADLADFSRLFEQTAWRLQREGQHLAALTLRVQLDSAADEALRLNWLAQCMHRLRHQVRATDTLVRWKTTNFGILLPRCTPLQAEAVLARLVRRTSGPYHLEEQVSELSVRGHVVQKTGLLDAPAGPRPPVPPAD